jgi:multicomponent Na+:H+ antiporter subunit D
MSDSLLVSMALVLPWCGAVFIALLGRYPNLREAVTLLTAAGLFGSVCALYPAVSAGERPVASVGEVLPGLWLAFEVEPLGMLFALVASSLWILTSLYSIGYMRAHREEHQTRFYTYFAIALAATIGVAFSANAFSLFIFYEVLTLSTYPLVTHAGTEEAKRAGRVYLGILLATSIGLLLLGLVWTWSIAGTLDFTSGGVIPDQTSESLVAGLLALYVFGVGKAAIMPFHRWLPAAMVAPTPVSALLHAVAVVKAGVFSILKIAIYLFGIDSLGQLEGVGPLAYVAAATMLIASVVALRKDNLKIRLAYSTISQLSYIVLGTLLANGKAVIGAGMHIAMHAFGKITLFFCAGAIFVATHKTTVSEMQGLGRTMPITMGAFFVASLCIVGLPPTGGLWSKWFLGLGTLDAGHFAFLVVLMLSSVLSVAYLLPIPIKGFFGAPGSDGAKTAIREAPIACLIALVATSLGCVALFVFPQPVYELMRLVV